jgi:hypothetical protein
MSTDLAGRNKQSYPILEQRKRVVRVGRLHTLVCATNRSTQSKLYLNRYAILNKELLM